MNGWNACPRGSMHAPGTHHVGNTSYWWLVHAAEGGGAVERRPGALHHLDPLYVGERHHVPVDPTPVALVRRYAVDEQQHARSEALDETARATDVDLAIEEQHARRSIDGLVHRGHGAAREIGVIHDRDARRGFVEELGVLGRRDDRGLQLHGGCR